MFNISNLLQTTHKFKKLYKLNNNILALVTTLNKILFYSEDRLIKEIYHPYLDFDISYIIFSKDSNLMAFYEQDNVHIINTTSEQLIQTIKLESETIEFIAFDLESKYLFISTINRYYKYKYSHNYALTKESFFKSSTVNVVSVGEMNIAMGCEDGNLYIKSFNSKLNDKIIKNNSSKINSIYYFDNLTILTGDDKGDIYINYLNDKVKKIETGFTKIRQIVRLPESNYIFVVGDSNYLSIYDVNSFKLISSKYIGFESNIDTIAIIDRYNFFVLLKNGHLKRVTLENLSHLNYLIVNNLLDKAFRIIEEDSILKDSDEYKKIETLYSNIHNQAIKYLVENHKNKALELLEPFKDLESKKQKIKQLFKAFDYYERFKILVIQKKYLIAYSITNKFVDLQQTPEYEEIENRFKYLFKVAQQMIISGNIMRAKLILDEFMTVIQKRYIIKLLLNNNDEFIKLLKAIESEDFKTIYKITKADKTFLKIYDYKSIENKIELIIKKIQNNIKFSNLESAYEYIERLTDIDFLKPIVSKLLSECNIMSRFQEVYDNDNFILCYELLDENIFLHSVELASFLHKHWQKIIDKCENLALSGDLNEVKNILGELICIKTRRDKIGDLLRVCFYVQVDMLKNDKEYKRVENLIYLYIDIFGLDSEITAIMEEYEGDLDIKLAITQNRNLKNDDWIYSELIMGDLVHHRDDGVGSIIKLIN